MDPSATILRPRLSPVRIVEMNLGFLGLQFSFGLQQGNMGPIYSFLGAGEGQLPLLQLAGPITGLLIQPLVGALLCAIGLLAMPLSASLVMAVSLLWVLDAGNNITMEPYRAYVADRLSADQRHGGFLTQSAFTGLAQMLAYLTPSLLVLLGMDRDWVDAHGIPYTVRTVFWFGAALSLVTVAWSVLRVPELPLGPAVRRQMADQPRGLGPALADIGAAIRAMPPTMRKLGVMNLFQWFALWGYWTYIPYVIARNLYATTDPNSAAFREAVLTNGQMGAFYNLVAFLGAFAMMPLVRRFGAVPVHAACLLAGGFGMLALPGISDKALLFGPMIGIGLAWGSIMGNPFAILSEVIPGERTGVYMGIFNMMIVLPMLLFSAVMSSLDLGFVTLGLGFYETLLGNDPRNVVLLCGLCLLAAGISVLWIRGERPLSRVGCG